MFLTFIVLAIVIAVVSATTGVDVSQATSKSSWGKTKSLLSLALNNWSYSFFVDCAKSNGYNFAIVRVYQSSGKCDPNGPSNINNAWSAGFAHVDGYIFPCYSCGNPKKQVDDTISYLSSHGIMFEGAANGTVSSSTGVKYGMLWFDVEGTQVRRRCFMFCE